MKIILASGSGVRKIILDKYNIETEVVVSNVDEDEIKESLLSEGASPLVISKNLAEIHLQGAITSTLTWLDVTVTARAALEMPLEEGIINQRDVVIAKVERDQFQYEIVVVLHVRPMVLPGVEKPCNILKQVVHDLYRYRVYY